jgi:hypothetical protein
MAKNISNPIERAELPKFDDRQIYNGAVTMPFDMQNTNPGYAIPRHNVRKASRKKTTTSNIVAFFFGVAIVCLLYVGNVIAVNNLAKEINDLNNRYNSILSMNEVIKAEIARKASLERISLMAQEKLGMMNPKDQPVWFEVPAEKIAEVKEKLEP